MKRYAVLLLAVVMIGMSVSAWALSSGSAGLRDDGGYTGSRYEAKNYKIGFSKEPYLNGNWTWPVYSAPSYDAVRCANGKASVHMEDDMYSACWSGAWLLVRYPKVTGGFRVGWVPKSEINRPIDRTRDADFAYWPVTLKRACALTDDPLYESEAIAYAAQGERLTYLCYYQYNGGREYAYVRGELDGRPMCGFIPFDAIDW